MPDIQKVIKGLESLRDICNAKSNMAIGNGKVAWAGYANAADDAIALLKEQEQKTGHWTTKRTLQHDGEWYCDQCEYEPTVFENTPFCPNCGAKMEGR